MNISVDQRQIIWAEKYRPQKISECILPDDLKTIFQKYVDDGIIGDNLLLSGPPGLGKTTVALALMHELQAEYIFINASLKGNIDTLRNEISEFATRSTLDGSRKYVIFDEAERMSAAAQDGIRGFIQEFSKTCGFIFTCNAKNMLSDAIQSRLANIEFSINADQRKQMLKAYYKRVCEILDNEGIEYDPAAIVSYMSSRKNTIDFRSFLVYIQKISKLGKIEISSIDNINDESDFNELISFMKQKDFSKVRKWVSDNGSINPTEVYRRFYDSAYDHIEKGTVPILVVLIAKYQYQAAFVADPEINLAAFLVEVMIDVEFR
jgi:DNA polymerase III delta prime subunit